MIPELGAFSLIFAACMAMMTILFGFKAVNTQNLNHLQIAKRAVWVQAGFIYLSFFCLVESFISNNFTVTYVANHSNSLLPLFYRIGATWGGHEGSLLLWMILLITMNLLFCWQARSLPNEITARVLVILSFISLSFLLFTILTSNPFARELVNIPANGRDLNPLLQDPGLILHPPMLYLGYVGFALTYAIACAALWRGCFDSQWAKIMEPWALSAWCCLTLGITMGSLWAYRELGWGGWWFWDPVENASFIPWLIGTALIHSLRVVVSRGLFKSWALLLAILAFSFSLLGTFLVRSGVLTTVHAFANDPSRGAYLLIFLVVVIGGALTLYALRASTLSQTREFSWASREFLLLINNALLVTAALTILMGTLYPLILDTLGLDKISVGASYFNTVFIPIIITLLIFAGIGPMMYWKNTKYQRINARLLWGLTITAIFMFFIWYSLKSLNDILAILGIACVLWILVTLFINTKERWQKLAKHKRLSSLFLVITPMTIAHIGLAFCVFGITISSVYSLEQQVRMQPGDKYQLGSYSFYFHHLQNISGANYHSTAAYFTVTHPHEINPVHLIAEKRNYFIWQTTMTDAAIDAGLLRDIYIALGEPLDNQQTWSVRLYVKPFVRWIWFGGLTMLFGGLLALFTRIRLQRPIG
jgi:cytochrome c-type biogenesis protein CcmF